jgi:hypothetical protein
LTRGIVASSISVRVAFDPCPRDSYAAIGSHATVLKLTDALLYVQFVQLDE